MNPPPSSNKNLVVLRCGRNSLHPEWVKSGNRNWDLVLCPYETIDADDRFHTYADPECAHSNKWSGLYRYFTDTEDWKTYDFIWLPDDDILASTFDVNRFFDLCHARSPKLAAPALSHDSYFSHIITLVNHKFLYRQTTFVEIMMPCFRVDFLDIALNTFNLSQSGTGFGLDFLWPAMLGYRDVTIFDQIIVRHTRPVGALRTPELNRLAKADMSLIVDGMDIPPIYKTLAGETADGSIITADDPTFFLDYLTGYRYLVERYENFVPFLHNLQSAAIPQF